MHVEIYRVSTCVLTRHSLAYKYALVVRERCSKRYGFVRYVAGATACASCAMFCHMCEPGTRVGATVCASCAILCHMCEPGTRVGATVSTVLVGSMSADRLEESVCWVQIDCVIDLLCIEQCKVHAYC